MLSYKYDLRDLIFFLQHAQRNNYTVIDMALQVANDDDPRMLDIERLIKIVKGWEQCGLYHTEFKPVSEKEFRMQSPDSIANTLYLFMNGIMYKLEFNKFLMMNGVVRIEFNPN